MYIEFDPRTPDMVVKGEGGAIVLQVGVTNGVAYVLWHKIIRSVKPKKVQNTIVHTSTEKYVEPINILTFFAYFEFYFYLYCQLYQAVSQLKPGENFHHKMTAISDLWRLFPYIYKGIL